MTDEEFREEIRRLHLRLNEIPEQVTACLVRALNVALLVGGSLWWVYHWLGDWVWLFIIATYVAWIWWQGKRARK